LLLVVFCSGVRSTRTHTEYHHPSTSHYLPVSRQSIGLQLAENTKKREEKGETAETQNRKITAADSFAHFCLDLN